MITIIARKECKELLRDGRFWLAAAVLMLLLGFAFLTGSQNYREAIHQHAHMQQTERERWLNQGNKNPHSAAHQGIFVFRPQILLGAADPGIDPYVGRAVHLEAHRQRLFRYRPAEDAHSSRRFGELTAAAILQKLIPLFVILLSYAAFVGEREGGTLRQLLSLGVRPHQVAWGKTLGLTLPLSMLLIPAAVAGAIALLFHSPIGPAVALTPRFILMTGVYLLYFAIFVGITLVVSAVASSSRQALAVLLGIWFVACVMFPPMVTDFAQRVYPAPGALDFGAALREGKLTLPVWYEQLGSVERRLLKQYGVSRTEELPVDAQGMAMVEEEDDFNRVQDRLFGDLYQAYRSQNRLAQFATMLNPALAVQSLSMGLAGTDLEQHLDFALAAERYRQKMVQLMNRDIAVNGLEKNRTPVAFPGLLAKSYQPGRELWETVPPFTYTFFNSGRVLSNYRISLVFLVLWTLVVAACGVRLISRLKEGS
jgi:ABC-2 type transport system permease protein